MSYCIKNRIDRLLTENMQNEAKKTKTTVFTAIATKELDTWPEAESKCNVIVY